MAFCSKCGAQINDDSAYCPNCGAATGTHTGQQTSGSDAQNNKAMGILAYFGILVLIPIFAAKDSPFAKYHANQGLVLFIIEAALSIVNYVLRSLFQGWIINLVFSILFSVASALLGVLAIIGIVHAAKSECKPLPVIGSISILK